MLLLIVNERILLPSFALAIDYALPFIYVHRRIANKDRIVAERTDLSGQSSEYELLGEEQCQSSGSSCMIVTSTAADGALDTAPDECTRRCDEVGDDCLGIEVYQAKGTSYSARESSHLYCDILFKRASMANLDSRFATTKLCTKNAA
eukprot:SAG31_NODE_3241_length_4506_cov_1.758112_1_plen_147_part_10